MIGMKTMDGQCQVCDGYLQHVMSLGYLPPPNDMRPIGVVADQQSWMPTDLMLCTACSLVQLAYTGPKETVFPSYYPYTSGVTKMLRNNFADLYREMSVRRILKPYVNMVIDIGSNDGTLLSNFARSNMILGVEPTDIAKQANAHGIPTMQEFFDAEVARRINTMYPKIPKVVTCANCFAHMENVSDIMTGILELIGDDGVFVSESTYLMDTLDKLQYDTIYHEHLRYYSITSITNLLRRYGLEIFHVKHIPPAGGSIRVYASRPGLFPITYNDGDIPEPTGQALVDRLEDFARDVVLSKHLLMNEVFKHKVLGHKVAGISAPSRSSTVINYCRLELDYICELPGSLKMGRYAPGTNTPVVNESVLFGPKQPEAAILFSWHIADEVIPKLREKGFKGEIILPCSRYNRFVDLGKRRELKHADIT